MNACTTTEILTSLIIALENHGSWSGETHIQKCAYILKEVFDAPIDAEFVLYKHGPFSFDLRDQLSMLIARNVVEVVPRPAPYGPSLVAIQEIGVDIDDSTLADSIDSVAAKFGTRTVAELERLATALYVMRENPDWPEDGLARRIVELKPHISRTLAESAVLEVQQLSRPDGVVSNPTSR